MRVDEPEEQTIARYLGGLRKEIHDVITLQPYWSYDDVYKLAVKVEKQLKQKINRTTIGFGSRNSIRRDQPSESVQDKAKLTTKLFEKGGTSKMEVGSSSSRPNAPSHRMVKCFKCSGLGHMQADCPNKSFVNLTEEVLFLEDSVKEDDSPIYDAYIKDDEGVTWSDHGEALVIQ